MAAEDPYIGETDISGPASRLEAVTPDDSGELAQVTRALYVGTGGNIKVDGYHIGEAVVLSNVPDGTVLPIRVTRVYATDTTASDIVALG